MDASAFLFPKCASTFSFLAAILLDDEHVHWPECLNSLTSVACEHGLQPSGKETRALHKT